MRKLSILLLLSLALILTKVVIHGQTVPGTVGGQDMFGAYDVVKGWPKDISTLPGNEKWTWGAGQSVYAESPNRVFMLFRGELPNIQAAAIEAAARVRTEHSISHRPPALARCDHGFAARRRSERARSRERPPMDGRARSASTRSGRTASSSRMRTATSSSAGRSGTRSCSARTSSPSIPTIRRSTSGSSTITCSAIYKFTHDGKELVQTIGTPKVTGADGTHFNRPTFLAWLPDSTMFVADGYNGTRVAKFDKNGKFLLDWGQKGTPPNDKRPGYMNNVHGIAVDPQTRRVFVNDRGNKRIQVFDENGKYLYEWSMGEDPSDIHLIYIGADRTLWAADRGTSKMLKYDLEGHFLYSWGIWGDFAGGFWGVHGFSVDQEGNFYVAEVDSGRVQKFRPEPGANPAYLVGKPVYSAWK